MKSPFAFPLAAEFYKLVDNKTAPGGKVAMYSLSDAEGKTEMALSVPPARHDYARFVAHAVNLHGDLVETVEFARNLYQMQSDQLIRRLRREQEIKARPDIVPLLIELEQNQRLALAYIAAVLEKANA